MMEKNMEDAVLGLVFRDISIKMENQMEEKMEN